MATVPAFYSTVSSSVYLNRLTCDIGYFYLKFNFILPKQDAELPRIPVDFATYSKNEQNKDLLLSVLSNTPGDAIMRVGAHRLKLKFRKRKFHE